MRRHNNRSKSTKFGKLDLELLDSNIQYNPLEYALFQKQLICGTIDVIDQRFVVFFFSKVYVSESPVSILVNPFPHNDTF